MDSLSITGLNVLTHIGIHAWEQQIMQRLLIDITIATDFTSCRDNDLCTTIDYDALCQQVTRYVQANNFRLIETVAQAVALLIKKDFNIATNVTVSVSKPYAIANAGTIQVTVKR